MPNGTATGLDIGLSNFSLSLITLSFYTMCKSTTPVFLLAFCFLWGIERCARAHLPRRRPTQSLPLLPELDALVGAHLLCEPASLMHMAGAAACLILWLPAPVLARRSIRQRAALVGSRERRVFFCAAWY